MQWICEKKQHDAEMPEVRQGWFGKSLSFVSASFMLLLSPILLGNMFFWLFVSAVKTDVKKPEAQKDVVKDDN